KYLSTARRSPSNPARGRPITSVDISRIPSDSAGDSSLAAKRREDQGTGYLKDASSPFLLQVGDRSSRISGATASGGWSVAGSSPGMAFWRMRVRRGPGLSRLAQTDVPLHSAA